MRTNILVSLVLFSATALAACGDDGEGTGTGGASAASTSASSTSGTGGETSSSSSGTGGGGADWACLGDVSYPAPSVATAKVSFVFSDLLSQMPIAGLLVRACPKDDPTCAGEITQGTTDADGAVELSVPTGTVGFQGTFNTELTGYVPGRILIYPEPTADSPVITMALLSDSGLALGLVDVGITEDPARGHVAAAGLDCSLLPAPGVSLAVLAADASSTTAYVKGMGLDTAETATGPAGQGMIFNVPVGPTQVTATLKDNGAPIGVVDAPVEVGTITYVSVPPTPAP